MVLADIKEYLLVNSLQYFIGQDDIEVTDEVLENLSLRALSYHSNWRPILVQEEIYINDYNITLKTTDMGNRILNVQNLYYIEPMLGGSESAVTFNWDYNKDNGLFRAQIQGRYVFELLVVSELSDIDMTNIEFLDLMQGLYLMYIGSSRKAFALSEAPFENDGSELYDAGKELWDDTLEALKNEQDSWYMAIN